MNKSAIYTTLLFILILTLVFLGLYTDRNIASWEGDGVQFTVLRNTDFIGEGKINDVFIIHNKDYNDTRVYKRTDTELSSYKIYTIKLGEKTTSQLFLEAINEELIFEDTLINIKRMDLLKSLEDGKNIIGARLESSEDNEGLFGFIDDSVFIFLLAAFVVLFLFLVHDGIIYLIKIYTGKNIRHAIYGFLIICFYAYYLFRFYSISQDPNSNVFSLHTTLTLLIEAATLILGYTLFQFFKTKYLQQIDFADQELIKFLVLFFGVTLHMFISTWIIKITFNTLHPNGILYVPSNIIRLFIGFAFSFALANLLNNLIQYFIKLRIDKSEKQLQFAQQKTLASQAELNALQASVNPHFLYNSLNSIASLAQIDSSKTEKMALALSSFYKYTTNREEEHLCTLAAEIEMIQNYLAIEKIRFGERLVYTIQCSAEAKQFKIPRFLLQPIVENAIKFGYSKTTNKIEIDINAKIENDNLELFIFDSGEAFPDDMQMGYGLKSVLKKLKLLFPDGHKIEFINRPDKQVFIMLSEM